MNTSRSAPTFLVLLLVSCTGCPSKPPAGGAGGDGGSATAGGSGQPGGGGGSSNPTGGQSGTMGGSITPPGTPAPGADFAFKPALPLEIFKAEGFAFAKPQGFTRETGGTGYRFVAPAGSAITAFQLSHVGRMNNKVTPRAMELLQQEIERRKATLLGNVETSPEYATATLDTGAPGAARFVRLVVLRYWDLPEELLTPAIASQQPAEVDVFTAEFSAASEAALAENNIPFLLRAIAWSISIPPTEVPAAELSGVWRARFNGLTGNDYIDPSGRWVGGQGSGAALQINFRSATEYELFTYSALKCTGMATPGCIESTVFTASSGRYAAGAGLLVLSPSRCGAHAYAGSAATASSSRACDVKELPPALHISTNRFGWLSFSGIAVMPVKTERKWTVNATRLDGSGVTAPADCGLADPEPNDNATQATSYTLGQAVTACLREKDVDVYSVSLPADAAPAGYIVGSLTEIGDGKIQVLAEGSVAKPLLMSAYTDDGMHSLHFYWSVPNRETYRVTVKRFGPDSLPFKYSLRLTYTPVNDSFEPNDVQDQAKPISVGTPVTAFLFGAQAGGQPERAAFADWYKLTLAAGPVSVSFPEFPEGLRPDVALLDPAGNYLGGVVQPSSIPYTGTANISAAGEYRIQVTPPEAPFTTGKLATPDAVPGYFTKPYKMVVSQP